MNVALIPARAGSKSIPKKNIKKIAGKPLIFWSVKAASECDVIDKVFVSTDCEEIAKIVKSFDFAKVIVIDRSTESATDTASTETVMLEFAHEFLFENICLIQTTSPLVTSVDLKNGFKAYNQENIDSVLSVVKQKRFLWKDEKNGFSEPVNYDYKKRPQRQEFDGFLVENGAFYITGREALLRSKCRLSGNIKTSLMPSESYVELDEPEDWIIVEQFLKQRQQSIINIKTPIKLLLTDCDGTLTDAGMYYSKDGDIMKKFNTRDGVGLRMLRENGIKVGIVTGEVSEAVKKRAEKLQINELFMGAKDKTKVIMELCQKYEIEPYNIAFIGDDINDLSAMQLCGFKACPVDAIDEIREICDYISPLKGGFGAVRDICEVILKKMNS